MLFSFGFDSYLDKLISLSKLIKNKTINKTSFSQSPTPVVKFSKIYSPNINCNNIIKNTFNLSKNKLITGPNASGKTTLLKTTLSNIIISQQIGFGFYNKAVLTPFDTFHCYINIPDTSSRDSLFQAEARQCLNIINNISQNTDKKHFCIFDELFSGTNPFEAVSSAQSYLDYISNFKNVKFMLTTHFIKLCNNLKSNKCISNINMETIIHNNVPTYKYKIKKGISDAKGGISVLKQLNYPDKIVANTINNLKTI
jgi:DNA mismatch repair ATPase MutS